MKCKQRYADFHQETKKRSKLEFHSSCTTYSFGHQHRNVWKNAVAIKNKTWIFNHSAIDIMNFTLFSDYKLPTASLWLSISSINQSVLTTIDCFVVGIWGPMMDALENRGGFCGVGIILVIVSFLVTSIFKEPQTLEESALPCITVFFFLWYWSCLIMFLKTIEMCVFCYS